MPEIAEPEYIGEGKVWQTPSKSRPAVRHITIQSTDGIWFCYCEGYRYTGKCWHVDTLSEQDCTCPGGNAPPYDSPHLPGCPLSNEDEFHVSI